MRDLRLAHVPVDAPRALAPALLRAVRGVLHVLHHAAQAPLTPRDPGPERDQGHDRGGASIALPVLVLVVVSQGCVIWVSLLQ